MVDSLPAEYNGVTGLLCHDVARGETDGRRGATFAAEVDRRDDFTRLSIMMTMQCVTMGVKASVTIGRDERAGRDRLDGR